MTRTRIPSSRKTVKEFLCGLPGTIVAWLKRKWRKDIADNDKPPWPLVWLPPGSPVLAALVSTYRYDFDLDWSWRTPAPDGEEPNNPPPLAPEAWGVELPRDSPIASMAGCLGVCLAIAVVAAPWGWRGMVGVFPDTFMFCLSVVASLVAVLFLTLMMVDPIPNPRQFLVVEPDRLHYFTELWDGIQDLHASRSNLIQVELTRTLVDKSDTEPKNREHVILYWRMGGKPHKDGTPRVRAEGFHAELSTEAAEWLARRIARWAGLPVVEVVRDMRGFISNVNDDE